MTPQPVEQDRLEQGNVNRVGLVVGQPFYWQTNLDEGLRHSEGLPSLIRWFLHLPEAWLGVDAIGAGQIVSSVLGTAEIDRQPELAFSLQKLGISPDAISSRKGDRELCEPYLENLIAVVRAAEGRDRQYVWYRGTQGIWWAELMERAFDDYSKRMAMVGDERPFYQLFSRHRCTLFAALTINELIQGAPDPKIGSAIDQFMGSVAEKTLPFYVSWRLVEFAISRNEIICKPMLTIWSGWPEANRAAPPTPDEPAIPASLSINNALWILQEFYRNKLTNLKSYLLGFFGIPSAAPRFAGLDGMPAVFYILDYASKDPLIEQRRIADDPGISQIIRVCLGSDDPLSKEVSWGVLEGDLLAARREVIRQNSYQAYYVLLPTRSRPASAIDLEHDIDFITTQLSFLEFSISNEARDIHTDYQELAHLRAVWGGTVDSLSLDLSRMVALLPSLSRGDQKRLTHELRAIKMPVAQLQGRMVNLSGRTEQLQSRFEGYIDGADDYFRRQFTISEPLNSQTIGLNQALMAAYPYSYLQQPMKSLRSQVPVLIENIAGVANALETLLTETDRIARESLEYWTRILGALAALTALVIALPQFIPGSVINQETYPAWLQAIIPLVTVEQVTMIIVAIAVMILIIGALLFSLAWLWERLFPRDQETLIGRIQQFWNGIERVAGQAGDAEPGWLEKQDTAMADELAAIRTQVVNQLSRLQAAGPSPEQMRWLPLVNLVQQAGARYRSPVVAQWIKSSRLNRRLLYLIDLQSDNIPLPRTLCLFRYKNADFVRLPISEWTFERSLRRARFTPEERTRLAQWLGQSDNLELIARMSDAAFLKVLEERGVSADPARRHPHLWTGPLIYESTPANREPQD
ncbi:MAG: hypothetical protein RMK84_16545 [Oscillochloridaceae bacterium]|nr:hypothetical protein [Chloroflexaceae bacterium]MDW8391737.1 hypothetical protein [Oscillochloridaceae bacterium]